MSIRGSILIVDDDRPLVDMVMQRLIKSGYKVTAAYDRAEAIIQAEAVRPSIVLCDLQMPVFGSGADAYKDFRSHHALKNVPVVFITGLPLEEAKKQVPTNDPKVRLLKKPVDWVMLEQAFEELLGHARPLAD